MINQLKEKKNTYEHAMWNPETVLLGGLGMEPELDIDLDPIKIYEKSLQRPKTRTKKIELFKPAQPDAVHNENQSEDEIQVEETNKEVRYFNCSPKKNKNH